MARSGLTLFTEVTRLHEGATGYAVFWRNGHTWEGIITHMGYKQQTYDAESAALAYVLETAS